MTSVQYLADMALPWSMWCLKKIQYCLLECYPKHRHHIIHSVVFAVIQLSTTRHFFEMDFDNLIIYNTLLSFKTSHVLTKHHKKKVSYSTITTKFCQKCMGLVYLHSYDKLYPFYDLFLLRQAQLHILFVCCMSNTMLYKILNLKELYI